MGVLCKRKTCVSVQVHNTQSDSSTKSFWGQRERKLGDDICAALQMTRTFLI